MAESGMGSRRKNKDLTGVPKITTYGLSRLRPLESRTSTSPSMTTIGTNIQQGENMADIHKHDKESVHTPALSEPGAGQPANTAQPQTGQVGEVSCMESRILEAIRKLDKKTDEMKTDMNVRLGSIEATLKENTGKITDLEEGVDFSNKEIDSHKDRLTKLEGETKKLISDAELDNKNIAILRDLIEEVEDGWREKLNDMERHARGYSIRVKGVQLEDEREDSRVTVAKILLSEKLVTGDDVGTVAKLIEHAHPLGWKGKDGRVNIIARFYSRPVRNSIIFLAKKKKYTGQGLKVVEDMTMMDFQARHRAFPQMQLAYQQGKKARFFKGKLIIDGKEVAIK